MLTPLTDIPVGNQNERRRINLSAKQGNYYVPIPRYLTQFRSNSKKLPDEL